MVCLNRPRHFKFFKGCFSQILLDPFLNTLPQIASSRIRKSLRRINTRFALPIYPFRLSSNGLLAKMICSGNHFAINWYVESLSDSEVKSGHPQTSQVESFETIVNSWKNFIFLPHFLLYSNTSNLFSEINTWGSFLFILGRVIGYSIPLKAFHNFWVCFISSNACLNFF